MNLNLSPSEWLHQEWVQVLLSKNHSFKKYILQLSKCTDFVAESSYDFIQPGSDPMRNEVITNFALSSVETKGPKNVLNIVLYSNFFFFFLSLSFSFSNHLWSLHVAMALTSRNFNSFILTLLVLLTKWKPGQLDTSWFSFVLILRECLKWHKS